MKHSDVVDFKRNGKSFEVYTSLATPAAAESRVHDQIEVSVVGPSTPRVGVFHHGPFATAIDIPVESILTPFK